VRSYGSHDFASLDTIPPGTKEFCGQLMSGELVRFVPIKKDSLGRKRFLSKYKAVSEVASIQQLFGLYTHLQNEYAVMEDLEGPQTPYELLGNSFSTNGKASVVDLLRNQRILLCHRVACIVQFLHSRDFIVKVISDKSIFVRKQHEELVPTLTNLDETRSVSQQC
jgi:serine/threonine protein kinase